MPFESVNTLANEIFPRGSNYYLKSVFQSGPQPDVAKSVFKRVCELNAAPGNEIEHIYLFEYTSFRNLLKVPVDATAYLRTSRSTTVSILKWARKSPDIQDAAKRAASELANIVTETEAQVSGESGNSGYGNLCSETPVRKTVNGVEAELDDSDSRVLFGSNYRRLQRLKAQYDPENVFSKWFPITPNADA